MGYIIQNINQKRQFLCNVTYTCIKFFAKTIQIIKKNIVYESSIKAIFFDGSFFLSNSVNSLISICLSDLKDTRICNKDPN